jgi:hypothetical protein
MRVLQTLRREVAAGAVVMHARPTTTDRPQARYDPPAHPCFTIELITDTAGSGQTGGSGASCWGFNQSNVVRAGEEVYALSWRDDLSLVVFRRIGPGRWEPSSPTPPVPQNGNLLVDSRGHLHLVAGANASFQAVFDPPGQVRYFRLRERASADSRFGAAINDLDQIAAGGGLERLAWYLLDVGQDGLPVAAGELAHEAARGYHFIALAGSAAHTFCGDAYFLAGDQYPNQTVTYRDLATGELKTIETPHGIYPVLKSYYLYCPDLLRAGQGWQMQVVSDVSDTFAEGKRGTTEQQDLLLDAEGGVHLIYFENRQPSGTVWAATGQDQAASRLYHAVGEPGGSFTHFYLGNFNSGRLYQTPDGRMHYFLTRGRRGDAESLWYAAGTEDWSRISEPVPLELPSRFWHFFTNTTRAGGTRAPFVDCYWTGAYRQNSHQVWYGRLDPE